MTESKHSPNQPLRPGNLPRKGQRVIITGAHIAGATPCETGQFATYVGVVNGHAAFEGNTSDRTYLDHTQPGRFWVAR